MGREDKEYKPGYKAIEEDDGMIELLVYFGIGIAVGWFVGFICGELVACP